MKTEQERFLRVIVDHLPGMVGYWDADLRCRFANSAYLDWFGRTPEQMHGVAMVELLGAELFAMNEPYIRGALRGEAQQFERALIKADGSIGHTLAQYIPDSAEGRTFGFYVLVTDISQFKQAQSRLEETNAALLASRQEAELASRAKSDFLASMSHELRTPMNAVLGFAQLMELDPNLPPIHKDNVAQILRAGTHLLDLINDVLSLSKIESGVLNVTLGNIESMELAKECLRLLAPLAAEHHVKLACDVEALSLYSDRRMLKQVLLNLLGNAIKYNRPQGTATLSLARGGDGEIHIVVSDTGVGIAPHQLSRVFEPFNRGGAEFGGVEGSGIGLTVSQRLVEALGGRISANSEVGRGSRFTIVLPARQSMADEQSPALPLPLPPPPLPSGQDLALTGTVLSVDDSLGNRRLIARILEAYPHIKLIEASSGEAAYEIALLHQPDLILMDINLPGMSGIETLKQLRRDAATSGIPAIAISADVLPSDVARIKEAGFEAYLAKPFDVATVLDEISCLLAPQMPADH